MIFRKKELSLTLNFLFVSSEKCASKLFPNKSDKYIIHGPTNPIRYIMIATSFK